MNKDRVSLMGDPRLRILIDSPSIDLALGAESRAERILQFRNIPLYGLVRSGGASHSQLKQVARLTIDRDSNGWPTKISVGEAKWFFYNRQNEVELLGKNLLGTITGDADRREAILLPFICETLNRWPIENGFPLILTENSHLLKARVELKRICPTVSIVGSGECMEIMDLYAKMRNQYYLSPNQIVGRGTWYFCQLRSAIPRYDRPDNRDPLGFRLVCLLKALDFMGILFYSNVDNDTHDDTIYHFNYFVSLMCGIFDSLALTTKGLLNLKFDRDNIPSRTSLSNNSGDKFLRALKRKNADLWEHILKSRSYINLVYAFRDPLIHRDILAGGSLNYTFGFERKDAIIIEVHGEIVEWLKQCGGFEYDLGNTPWSNWGVYRAFGPVGKTPGSPWVSPYVFSRTAARTLVDFTSEYLRILGFSDSLASNQKGWPFDFIKELRTSGLGLFNSWN